MMTCLMCLSLFPLMMDLTPTGGGSGFARTDSRAPIAPGSDNLAIVPFQTGAVAQRGQTAYRKPNKEKPVESQTWFLNAQIFHADGNRFSVPVQILFPEGHDGGKTATDIIAFDALGRPIARATTITHLSPTSKERVLYDLLFCPDPPALIRVNVTQMADSVHAKGLTRDFQLPAIARGGISIGQAVMTHEADIDVQRLPDIRVSDSIQQQAIHAMDPFWRDNKTLIPAFQSYVDPDGSASFTVQLTRVADVITQSKTQVTADDGSTLSAVPLIEMHVSPLARQMNLYDLKLDVSAAMRPCVLSIEMVLADERTVTGQTVLDLKPALSTDVLDLNDRLIAACRDGASPYELKHLIKKGAQPQAVDRNGNGLVANATFAGRHTLIGDLAEMGAPLDTRNREGYSALMIAAANGKTRAVRALLKEAPHLGLADVAGQTALHHAARRDRKRICALLIEAGADLNAVNASGHAPLMEAVAHAGPDVIALLWSSSVNGEARNNQGYGIVHLAALNPNLNDQILALLLDRGIDIDMRSRGGRTACMLAATLGLQRSVDILMPHTKSLELRDNAGETVLMLASASGHLDIVKQLIDAGANANTSNRGINALMLAAANGQTEIIRTLKPVTDPQAVDERGWRAIDYARQNGDPNLVDLFETP